MWLSLLRVERLRNLQSVELELTRGLVFVSGVNGAGKTSLLEAIALLGRGRSFRGGSVGSVISRGSDSLLVHAEVVGAGDRHSRVGFLRSARRWEASINGVRASALAELVRSVPVACFDPSAHAWIVEGSEGRRRLLDWVVFHVEQGFQEAWSRYQIALVSRNRGLREGVGESELDAWDAVLSTSGQVVAAYRNERADSFCACVERWWLALSADAPPLSVVYSRGWGLDRELPVALRESRDVDRDRGFTRLGPHRADLILQVEGKAARDVISRGQQKTLALCFLMAQLELVQQGGEKPIVLLDDFPSEIDSGVQHRLLDSISAMADQVWMSGTSFDSELFEKHTNHQVFHVKHGEVHCVSRES